MRPYIYRLKSYTPYTIGVAAGWDNGCLGITIRLFMIEISAGIEFQ